MASRKGYKFTNKRHSEKAVMSTVFGVLSLASLIAVLYLAYLADGEAPVSYGISGILIFIFAVTGLILGVLAVREVDKFKIFAWLGCILNFLSLMGISGILYAGAYM